MRFFETLNYTGLGNRLYWPPSMVTSSLNTEAASIASNPRGLAQDRQQYLVSNPKSLSVEKRTTICEELLKQIYEKAKFLRSLKTSPSSLNSSGDNISSTSSSSSSSSSSSGGVPRAARVPTKSEVIFELLELKYLYCLLNPVPVTDEQLLVDTEPKKTIKIRWSFVDPETKEETRLQYQFHNTVRIPMREVLKALRAQTTKQLDFNGGFAKIELVEKHYKILESADGVKNTTFKLTKKTYQALNLDDCILMPLKKPGPVLGVNESIELRVTWHAVVNPRTLPVELLKSGSRIVEKMIDTGVNFFDPSFGSTLPKLIDDAFASSVHQMIALSTNLETSKFSLELAKNRVGSVFATVGVHPSEASELPFETESEKLLALLKEGGVIGVGECGIKRTETTTEDDLEKQKQWFRFQVKTAQQLGLPLFLNEQNGFDVLFQIIKEEARASQRDTLSVPALVNCFNSSEEALESYLSMGFYIGVTGLLCNDARNQNLLPLTSKIPLDRLVVSTDAPYLTPFTMPKPFPKQNQPSLLAHVVIKIADVLGVHPSVIARNSTQNAQRFLNLPEILFDGNLHSLDEGIDLNPIVSYYGPRHAKKGDADVKKPEAKPSDNKDDKKVEAKPVEYPFPTFEFAGAVYRCTEKEKRLLDHQKERSNVEALRQLIADLELSPL